MYYLVQFCAAKVTHFYVTVQTIQPFLHINRLFCAVYNTSLF